MPIVKTEAFILKSIKYKETSKIVTLFTKDFGKMNAIVKGARSFKSKHCGVFESMNYINAVIYLKDNRDLQFISSAEYKSSFSNIQQDFEKIQSAYRIIDMLNKTLSEREISIPVFDLLIKCFKCMNEINDISILCFTYFQKELIKYLGYSPDLISNSNEYETFIGNIEFTQKKHLLENLRNIENQNLSEISEMRINPETLIRISEIYERFILQHTQGLNYYKSRKTFSELNQVV